MTKRKQFRLVLFIFFISLSILFISGCTREEKINEKKIIKIGAAIALTGYASNFGESEKNAITFLREKFKNDNIQFFLEDTKSNPKDGVNAVNKLINSHNVDIIYTELSTVARAISPIVFSNNKVLIAAVYLSDLIENNKYAIRALPTGKDESKLLLDYLKGQKISLENIAVLISNDEFGNTCLNDFKKEVSGLNVKIIYSNIIPDNMGIKNEVLKIIEKNPGVIYIGSLQPHVGTVIKELRILDYKGEIITTDAFAYPYIHNAAGEFARGTIYVDFPTNNITYKEFKKKYEQKFKKDLVPAGVLLYDALSCISELYMKSKSSDIDGFFEEINNTVYEGIYGTLRIINREFKYPLEIKKWKSQNE